MQNFKRKDTQRLSSVPHSGKVQIRLGSFRKRPQCASGEAAGEEGQTRQRAKRRKERDSTEARKADVREDVEKSEKRKAASLAGADSQSGIRKRRQIDIER